MSDWGRETSGIIEITLTAKNDFVIAKYSHGIKAEHATSFTRKIEYSSGSTATFAVTFSQDELHSGLNNAAVRQTVYTVLIVIFFGFILWKILQRTAIVPLQTEISRHEETTRQLQEAKTIAEKANKSKSEFLANMSNEGSNDDELLDKSIVESLGSILADEYPDLVRRFHEATAEDIDVILQDHVTMDISTRINKIHLLKGSSANVGAKKLASLFLAAEQNLVKDPGYELEEAFLDIKHCLKDTMASFNELFS